MDEEDVRIFHDRIRMDHFLSALAKGGYHEKKEVLYEGVVR